MPLTQKKSLMQLMSQDQIKVLIAMTFLKILDFKILNSHNNKLY